MFPRQSGYGLATFLALKRDQFPLRYFLVDISNRKGIFFEAGNKFNISFRHISDCKGNRILSPTGLFSRGG